MTAVGARRRLAVAWVVESPALQSIVVLAVFGIGALTLPGFSSVSSVRSMLVLAAFLGVAAGGQTAVALLGGIDLSIPNFINVGNVATSQLYGTNHLPFALIVALVLLFGGALGAFNGLVSKIFDINPLIVTLAVGSIIDGGLLVWTHAGLTGSAPAWLGTFTSPAAHTWIVPLAPVVVSWIVLGILFEVFLRRTLAGRRVYAEGANPTAARLMLVPERATWALCFGLSGALAMLAGLLLAGFTGAGLYDIGDPYLFTTIAAVVVGGSSLLGGRGSYLRTFLGVLALTEISTMLVGYGLSAAAQEAVYGAIIVAVVATYAREPSIRSRV